MLWFYVADRSTLLFPVEKEYLRDRCSIVHSTGFANQLMMFVQSHMRSACSVHHLTATCCNHYYDLS